MLQQLAREFRVEEGEKVFRRDACPTRETFLQHEGARTECLREDAQGGLAGAVLGKPTQGCCDRFVFPLFVWQGDTEKALGEGAWRGGGGGGVVVHVFGNFGIVGVFFAFSVARVAQGNPILADSCRFSLILADSCQVEFCRRRL